MGIAATSDARNGADLCETLSAGDQQIVHAAIGVMHEFVQALVTGPVSWSSEDSDPRLGA